MMDKILTVVVPTYNAEKYLRDNLESFCLEDLLLDIEILVINDGSRDGSLVIAQEYENRYPGTYRVITKENGGHGSGINWGIRHAVGKYFKVVDADDWVDADAFRKLVKVLKEIDTDVVYSGFLWTYDCGESDKNLFKTRSEIEEPFQGVEYQKVYTFNDIAGKLYMKMHNMTIRTAILKSNSIVIDENCYYVDAEYITYPIPYIDTICFVDAFVYYYRIGSVGQSVGIDKMQKNEANYDKVLDSLLNFYEKLGKEIPCTSAKQNYIAHLIARVVAGKMKIMLSFPASKTKQQQILLYDRHLRDHYGEIYHGNINKAVALLRKTRYKMYYLASFLVRKKY